MRDDVTEPLLWLRTSGLRILLEDQFHVGDVIRAEGMSGQVE